jgi:hypothetical protein
MKLSFHGRLTLAVCLKRVPLGDAIREVELFPFFYISVPRNGNGYMAYTIHMHAKATQYN